MTNVSPRTPDGLRAARDHELFAERYQLQSVLGRGGAAVVHQAFDSRLRRQVAIKVFRGDGDAGGDLARRFVDEARLLAGLRHPGLVEIFDFGTTAEGPYLVLELVPGGSLQHRIGREPLSPAQAAGVGASLAGTLAFIHGAGVVHRDVKPSNVLLDTDERPRLADFGVSRTMDAARATKTGNVVGTAAYLAPEQVLGRGAEPPADVYALGLVIIESLNGAREYPGPPAEAAVVRLHRPPAIPDGLPRVLAQSLRRMTAHDPAERPSAQACAEMLGGLAFDDVGRSVLGGASDFLRPSDAGTPTRTTRTASTLWVPDRLDPVPGNERPGRRSGALSLTLVGVLAAVGAAALAIGPAVDGPATRRPGRVRGPQAAPSASGATVPHPAAVVAPSSSLTAPGAAQQSGQTALLTIPPETGAAANRKEHDGPGKKKH